jgi:hypothetical protein
MLLVPLVLPLYESEPLRDDVLLSLVGLGLSAAVPSPLEGEPLAAAGLDEGEDVPEGAEVAPLSEVLLRVLDETPEAAPGMPSFAPVPPLAVVEVDVTEDGALVDEGLVDGALYVELLVCEVESEAVDFLFLFMSPMASAEALPSTMMEEKKTGASLRIGSS